MTWLTKNNDKESKTNTKTRTMTNTFREHLHRWHFENFKTFREHPLMAILEKLWNYEIIYIFYNWEHQNTRVTLDSIRNSYNVLISRLGSTVTIFELPQVHKGSKNGHFCRQTSQFQVEQIFWFWLNLCRGRDGSNTEGEEASGDAEVQGECGQVVRIESKLQSWTSQK